MKTIKEQFRNAVRTPSFKMFLDIGGCESYHEFDIYIFNDSLVVDFDIYYYTQLTVHIKPYLSLKEHLQLLYDKLIDKIDEVEATVCEDSDEVKDVYFYNVNNS